jgi:hypothetical protein
LPNVNLSQAKNAKNDEFYTQWADIEREVQAYLEFDPNAFCGKTVLCPCDDPYESNFFKYFALHFYSFGLKKLIATCYVGSPIANKVLSLFLDESEENKTTKKPHKIEITEIPDLNQDGTVNLTDVQLLLASDRNHLTRLQGDGDFRSEEIKSLRDEADMIITNPPFSLFREFLAWIVEADKQFLIIGNKNAITNKELFPLFKENRLWVGTMSMGVDLLFNVPDEFAKRMIEEGKEGSNYRIINGTVYGRSSSVWFTNIDHGRRHQPLPLLSMKDNLKHSRHKEMKAKKRYDKYDNYDAIDVPFTDAIPADYDGVMGVPISFLDKYCPEQFEIIWQASGNTRASAPKEILKKLNYKQHPEDRGGCPVINGKRTYSRVLISRIGGS